MASTLSVLVIWLHLYSQHSVLSIFISRQSAASIRSAYARFNDYQDYAYDYGDYDTSGSPLYQDYYPSYDSPGSSQSHYDYNQDAYGDSYSDTNYYDFATVPTAHSKMAGGNPEDVLGGVTEYLQQQQQDPHRAYRSGHGGYRRKKRNFKMVQLPKKPKKTKIISVDSGFYIPGGVQAFKKFSNIKGCMKACAASPTCFAGDYDSWRGRCFFHTNTTACENLLSHKKITHFKKVPCAVPEAPQSLVILGAHLHFALEQKGIKSLTDCIKKCASAGEGIPLRFGAIDQQICYGVDYDFSTHTCYFHVRNDAPFRRICRDDDLQTPRDLIAHPSTVFIAMCPLPRG